MTRPQALSKTNKLVWRITARSPRGEWVGPGARPTEPAKDDLPEVSYGGWVMSSFDLLNGVEVSEGPDTVPDDLFDALFHPPENAPKAAKE